MTREKLPLDASVEGPAILEQMDATTVIEPGDRADSDSRRQHHHRPSARPETMTLDAITLSVIQAALQQVCDEMDLTFSRAAFSPVIAEANDRSDGIYSADDGSLIAQGSRRPAGVRRRHAVFDQDADRDDRATGAACRPSRATSTSSTTPISAARI